VRKDLKRFSTALRDPHGFVLVTAMFILLVLVILGVAATNSSIFEVQIAGSDKVHKMTFSEADGGTEVASQLIEHSVNCPGGFKQDGIAETKPYKTVEGALFISGRRGSLKPWQNPPLAEDDVLFSPDDITTGISVADIVDALRATDDAATIVNNVDAYWPPSSNGTSRPYSKVLLGGKTELGKGSALQQLAGYEGKGKAASQGGAARLFDVYALHRGAGNSESVIRIEWRHLIGEEYTCEPDYE
jgi:hypothetical protein